MIAALVVLTGVVAVLGVLLVAQQRSHARQLGGVLEAQRIERHQLLAHVQAPHVASRFPSLERPRPAPQHEPSEPDESHLVGTVRPFPVSADDEGQPHGA